MALRIARSKLSEVGHFEWLCAGCERKLHSEARLSCLRFESMALWVGAENMFEALSLAANKKCIFLCYLPLLILLQLIYVLCLCLVTLLSFCAICTWSLNFQLQPIGTLRGCATHFCWPDNAVHCASRRQRPKQRRRERRSSAAQQRLWRGSAVRFVRA